jgi:predicted integral membrane protein DUF2269
VLVLVVAAYLDGLYKFLLVLHILCAIVGFGAVFLNALYGQQIRKHGGREGLAIYEANFFVSGVGQFFIYAVFVFGFLLVLVSDDAWKFDQTWVWLSMALYIVALGVSHGVLLPAVRRMGVLMRELTAAGPLPAGAAPGGPPPQAAELGALGQRVGAAGAFLDITLIVILALMVWKPGV